MPTYEQLDYGSPDGSIWGTSTGRIGAYGAAPTTQATLTTTQTTVTTTVAISSTITTTWGYGTSTQANDIVTQLNAAKVDITAIKTVLQRYGWLA